VKDLSEEVQYRNIEEEMKTSYINYAMSVIMGRALPDVRDGLKPVQRRILYAMNELNLRHNSSYSKCAKTVGDVLGKYHPHGDMAVYEALVRMAQDFNLRYPLIDGQGNFGSIDGDSAAAMRYTESRLAFLAEKLLQDIDQDTVDWNDNFDSSLKEPAVLPAMFPNLLVNGASGIAVGMATNIPPHNLTEVIDATIHLLKNPDASVDELMNFVKGPDFPTGGVIVGKNSIIQAYKTGMGKITVKGKAEIVEKKNGKSSIIITEIPYQVNKAKLVEQIAEQYKRGNIDNLSDLRDESNKKGIRIVMELKKNANPDIVMNQLFKYTNMKTTFGINLLALNKEKKPITYTLKGFLAEFLNHRKEVVRRRTEFQIRKAEKKKKELEALLIAIKHIDEIVSILKTSANNAEAKERLMSLLNIDEESVSIIVNMKLQRLTSSESRKIEDDLTAIKETILDLNDILLNESRLFSVIENELVEIRDKFGDNRRTEISDFVKEISDIDLIHKEDLVITITRRSYILAVSLDTYKKQRRNTMGKKGMNSREDDSVEHIVTANTHSNLLVFTDKGKVYRLPVYLINKSDRNAKGKHIINYLKIDETEKIRAVINEEDSTGNNYILAITALGTIKRTALKEFKNVTTNGIRYIVLNENDRVVDIITSTEDESVIVNTKYGMSIRFLVKDVRAVGRSAMGVRGIRLKEDDEVVSMSEVKNDKKYLLTITQKGYGKRTEISNYRIQSRGGKGIKNISNLEKTGFIVSTHLVNDDEDLILVSKKGVINRVPVNSISVIGRVTNGVRVMNLSQDDEVSSTEIIEKSENA
jgi:DNA gyrase subunit A